MLLSQSEKAANKYYQRQRQTWANVRMAATDIGSV
jgi:hypothetical protein